MDSSFNPDCLKMSTIDDLISFCTGITAFRRCLKLVLFITFMNQSAEIICRSFLSQS